VAAPFLAPEVATSLNRYSPASRPAELAGGNSVQIGAHSSGVARPDGERHEGRMKRGAASATIRIALHA
jgi:hypothetical protein